MVVVVVVVVVAVAVAVAVAVVAEAAVVAEVADTAGVLDAEVEMVDAQVEVAEVVVVVVVIADLNVQAVPTHLLLTLLTDYLRAGGAQAEKPRQVSAPARQHGCKVPDPLSRQP